jgi:predicted Fe-S protein YdhL (DUF1289 family)
MSAKELRKADLRDMKEQLQWQSRPMEDTEIRAVLINLCEQVAELQEKQNPLANIAYWRGEGELL